MAQLNVTLNQEEILSLLQDNSGEAFRKLLQDNLNSILKVESQEQLKAAPYERTEERTDSRNGTRERSLVTRLGTIVLSVPRHRNEPFKTMIFDNYCRSEAALISTAAEMVVNGVSTRKVSRVFEELCGKSISKSAVSELCKELDEEVQAFRNRTLTCNYPFVTVDATYFKVREDHRVTSKALMIAIAINENGRREIIGLDLYDREAKDTWQAFMLGLKARGLKGVQMITSDAHEGIIHAIRHVFPDIPWQRCQFHFTRNILDKTPKKYREGLRTELQVMFHAPTIEEAYKKKDDILNDYSDIAPQAMECLELGFESSMTVMCFPEKVQKALRTSNHIERINRELKRRSNAVGVFPNEASVVRLMGMVLLEYNEKLQSIVRPLFFKPTYQLIISQRETLKRIALEQEKLMSA